MGSDQREYTRLERSRNSGRRRTFPPGELTLAVADAGEQPWDDPEFGESVTISWGRDGLRVEPTDREPDVSLERTEMVDFLFGPSDARGAIGGSVPVLELLLPLEYYFWQTETI